MTSDYPDPEPIADIPEPYEDLLPNIPQRTVAVQNWNVTVSDAKFHWYDLVAGFPAVPDIRDPVGRYLRRMQFDLEATMEKRLLYLVVSRPLVRFDTNRNPSWGFFSLKLTLPLLVGPEQKRDSVTLELDVPFAATMKKPLVTVQERFLILNWGGLVEAMSIHDVLQHHDHGLKFASRVQYVGQTKDTTGRLAKGRLTVLQKLQQNNNEHSDTLLLVQRLHVEIDSAQGDPALLPANQNAVAADALLKDRMDLAECAVIKYFEGDVMRGRKDHELAVRRARMVEVQAAHNVQDVTIDLTAPEAERDRYYDLVSEFVPVSRAHRMRCHLINGDVALTLLPPERKS
jgi:hypothetical protein